MIGEKLVKILYVDLNGCTQEKWVNEYALFATIEHDQYYTDIEEDHTTRKGE